MDHGRDAQRCSAFSRMYGCNVCGEGGEYETLTLNCPLFRWARIVLDSWELVLHSKDSVAPVGVLHATGFHLESKNGEALADMDVNIIDVPEGASRNGTYTCNVAERALLATCLTELKPASSLPGRDSYPVQPSILPTLLVFCRLYSKSGGAETGHRCCQQQCSSRLGRALAHSTRAANDEHQCQLHED